MSRILLAWELGTGLGHLGPFLSLVPKLLERGHKIHIAAREISSACRAVDALPVMVHQAPLCLNTYGGLQEPPLNYAEILMRYGYLEPAMLRAMLAAWSSLICSTEADIVIADHAPTALLAARILDIPRAVIGGPFNVPPPADPMPNMRTWVAVPHQRLADSDHRVLKVINEAVPRGADIDALRRIFDGAAHFFSGVPELDPYGARDPGDYLGLQVMSTGSGDPTWPAGDGRKVFAYLNSGYKHLERALQALADSGVRVLAYVFGGNESLLGRYRSARLNFTPQPLDFHLVAADCDLCVCHGNSGTTLGMLHGGRPVLVLPMHLEHFLLGKRVESTGAGCVVHPETAEPDISGTLATMLGTETFGQNARALASRYAGGSVGTMTDRAIARIEALSAKAAGSQT
jgi:UDP:flavonoid glycosyltransferase YjiC (YdhE family)